MHFFPSPAVTDRRTPKQEKKSIGFFLDLKIHIDIKGLNSEVGHPNPNRSTDKCEYASSLRSFT